MKPTKSQEIIYHFSCGHCGKWWTIGDAPPKKKSWFCPWCGKKNDFSDKKAESLKNIRVS